MSTSTLDNNIDDWKQIRDSSLNQVKNVIYLVLVYVCEEHI